jgi:HSP20 family protein
MFDLIPFERRNGSLFDTFDRMMDDSFFGGMEKQFAPCRTDIVDQGDKYLLKADMPGFRKEDIKINVQGDELNITAERKEDNGDKNQKGNYIRRERRYDSLSRSFGLDGIDSGKITASYDNGVLELELPKVVEVKPDTTTIEIK